MEQNEGHRHQRHDDDEAQRAKVETVGRLPVIVGDIEGGSKVRRASSSTCTTPMRLR